MADVRTSEQKVTKTFNDFLFLNNLEVRTDVMQPDRQTDRASDRLRIATRWTVAVTSSGRTERQFHAWRGVAWRHNV